MPELYTDEAFSKTNHWELSTSQLSSPYLDGWGYGEGASAHTRLGLLMRGRADSRAGRVRAVVLDRGQLHPLDDREPQERSGGP